MDYSGVFEMSVLHLLALKMWFDDMVTTTINPVIYSGIPLAYPIYSAAHNIKKHRSYWAKPEEQKRILVLVVIPAVIGIVSWAELHVNEDRKTIFLLLDSIKECSAGLSIPMFMGLLQAYMNLNTSKLSPDAFRQKIRGRLVYNVFPVTLFQPRCVPLNQHNLELMNLLTWQYVAFRLVCTICMIAFQLCDMYPLWLSWMFFFVLNVSASVAYYTACAFYLAFVEDFPRLSYGKFLHIRGIFFFCFWQGGVFKILVATGLMKRNHFWRQELHNALLVLETTPLSFTHWIGCSARIFFDGFCVAIMGLLVELPPEVRFTQQNHYYASLLLYWAFQMEGFHAAAIVFEEYEPLFLLKEYVCLLNHWF